MPKEDSKEIEILMRRMASLEERIRKLEAEIGGQTKLLRDHGTYITHLRKKTKKTEK
jgi:archaellum component FlaC